ncbi:zinc finger protein 260-like [Musca vetustissima]|uniref:zinc finger protein 260-like n=1 Tax=Musca vetustissima TaxID=27455 RepID=UPI002AB72EDD|nr:zinc finger protein 260-like [Musca vetustissima]
MPVKVKSATAMVNNLKGIQIKQEPAGQDEATTLNAKEVLEFANYPVKQEKGDEAGGNVEEFLAASPPRRTRRSARNLKDASPPKRKLSLQGKDGNESSDSYNSPTTQKQNGDKRFTCPDCPRSFNKHFRLVEHQFIHNGEKPFTCDECQKQFRFMHRLEEHKQRHSKQLKFICEICNLGCCTRADYNLHMRHHSNDRRFQCSMCPKAFVRSADLKTHIRVHTGEKPFICEVCNKSFRANQNLIAHKKLHMGDALKNFKCEYCEKRFLRNIDRKIHMRKHTGEKPFKCKFCDRSYSSNVNVKAHMERDHSEGPVIRKKPGPKPKDWKEQIARQQKLIEELQAKLKQQVKQEEIIVPDCQVIVEEDDQEEKKPCLADLNVSVKLETIDNEISEGFKGNRRICNVKQEKNTTTS